MAATSRRPAWAASTKNAFPATSSAPASNTRGKRLFLGSTPWRLVSAMASMKRKDESLAEVRGQKMAVGHYFTVKERNTPKANPPRHGRPRPPGRPPPPSRRERQPTANNTRDEHNPCGQNS